MPIVRWCKRAGGDDVANPCDTVRVALGKPAQRHVDRPTLSAMARRMSAVAVTQVEAAHIIGCSVTKVRSLIEACELAGGDRYEHRCLDRDQVEHLAVRMWRPRRPDVLDDAGSYWVTSRQVAEMLGVGQNRVRQLVERGFLPCLRTPRGRLLFRRSQVEVVANARLSRRLQQA